MKNAYVQGAVTLPIAWPAGESWRTLSPVISKAWREATSCANWLMREHALRDVRPQAQLTTLPAMPTIHLYREARALWPDLTPDCIGALHQKVQAKYLAEREAIILAGERSLSTYRYPVPLPFRREAWRLACVGGRWQVAVRMLSGGSWHTLHVDQWRQTRKQIRVLEQMAAGEVEAGEATLYGITARKADHRSGPSAAGSRMRLMLKLFVWLPVVPRENRAGTWYVRTAADAFLVAGATPDQINWTLHGAHIPRVLMAVAHQRRQLAEDLRAERQPSRRTQEGIVDRVGQIKERSRHRCATWAQQAAAQLVSRADRQLVATLVYDDHIRSFARSFPWNLLQREIAQRCEQCGIVCMTTDSAASR